MNFKQWIKQAYGIDSDDHTARLTVYNMEVDYEAGKQSADTQQMQRDILQLNRAVEYQQRVIYHLVEKLKEKE